MDIVKKIREKAGSNLKRIVLPEIEDPRVREAVKIINEEGIARATLLDKNRLNKKDIEIYAQRYFNLRKYKGITLEEARDILRNPLYYAAMMVREGESDGFVAGASNTTPNVARAAIQCLGVGQRVSVVSSCFMMVVPDCPYGEQGIFFFADCGIVPEPTSQQLAQIAISTAELAQKVFGFSPRIAMLSYSTKGSAQGKCPDKIKEATELAKELSPDLCIDGELQLDSAIIPSVAKIKDPQGRLAGEANVLIFPNLEAGNIGYKLVQRLAKARAIGPILQGLNYPCSDLSRGCSVEDIIDCVAVTALRAQSR